MTDATKDNPLDTLGTETYVNLETFRKNGTGVKTPVWVARVDDRLVIFTDGTSYKVKRLRRNPDCRVAACGVRGAIKGPWSDGTAVLIDDDPAREKAAYAALVKKYGWQMRMTNLFSRIGGRIKRRKVIEVTFE